MFKKLTAEEVQTMNDNNFFPNQKFWLGMTGELYTNGKKSLKLDIGSHSSCSQKP